MIRNRILVAFAAGMTLLAGCATAAPVPAQTAPASVPPASDAPATSAAAPAGSDIDDFMANGFAVHNCQGFSTSGKRILEDPRNQLFREYVQYDPHPAIGTILGIFINRHQIVSLPFVSGFK